MQKGESMTDREQMLDELRPVSFAIAYRMLGTVSEAEDVVQEALLRVHQAIDAGEQLDSPRAYISTITNIANESESSVSAWRAGSSSPSVTIGSGSHSPT